jgi:arginase
LVPDEPVVQIGQYEGPNADFGEPNISDTAITWLDGFTARDLGSAEVIARNIGRSWKAAGLASFG